MHQKVCLQIELIDPYFSILNRIYKVFREKFVFDFLGLLNSRVSNVLESNSSHLSVQLQYFFPFNCSFFNFKCSAVRYPRNCCQAVIISIRSLTATILKPKKKKKNWDGDTLIFQINRVKLRKLLWPQHVDTAVGIASNILQIIWIDGKRILFNAIAMENGTFANVFEH